MQQTAQVVVFRFTNLTPKGKYANTYMIRNIMFLVLSLISLQTLARIGININFWIISQNDFTIKNSKGRDVTLKRYIVVPDFDKNYENILETKDEIALLAKFSVLLEKNKSTLIEKYISNCDTSLDINNLIKGLYFFSKYEYSQALPYFENFRKEEYKFLKLLLIADCKYELLQDKTNYKSVMSAYQSAFDSADKEQNKLIINNRIKYIKYR